MRLPTSRRHAWLAVRSARIGSWPQKDAAQNPRPGGLVLIHDVANAREPNVVTFWLALDEKDHVIRNDSQVWGPAGGVVVKEARE